MDDIDFSKLLAAAANAQGEFSLRENFTAGAAGAALLTQGGRIFTGICLDFGCGLGFCAEAAAIAEMLKARETCIRAVVAVGPGGEILPPCGRCRELMVQLAEDNLLAQVLVAHGEVVPLTELLPHHWLKSLALGA